MRLMKRHAMRHGLAGLGILAALTAHRAEAQDSVEAVPVVSLADALQMARTVRPSMIQAMSTLKNADAQRRAALGVS